MADDGAGPGPTPPPRPTNPPDGPPKDRAAYPPIPPHIARRIGHIVGPATRSVLKRRAEVGLARAA